MLVCVTGDGFVSSETAMDLLEDMLGSFTVEFMMPRNLAHTGQRNVAACLQPTVNRWELSRVPLGNLMLNFLESDDDDKVLLVLDSDTCFGTVEDAWWRDIPVFDLSRGLWPVTASQTDGEAPVSSLTSSQVSGHGSGTSESYRPAESLLATPSQPRCGDAYVQFLRGSKKV